MRQVIINEQQFNRILSDKSNGNVLNESFDLEDYCLEYDVNYVLNCFKNSKKGTTQNWGPLINPLMYQKALAEFTQYGRLISFPTKYIYQWIGIIAKNTSILYANTQLAGHTTYYPMEKIESFVEEELGDKFYKLYNDCVYIKLGEKEFLELCSEEDIYINESNGIHKDGQYDLFMNQEETDKYDKQKEQLEQNKKFYQYKEMADQLNQKSINRYGKQTRKFEVDVQKHVICQVKSISNYLDEIGLYDWMQMPDGSDAISDYGLTPIYKLLEEYNDEDTPEKILVLINKILDIYHQRGDLSSIFIQGGKNSLSKISNGTMVENKKLTESKHIIIGEQQFNRLLLINEAFKSDILRNFFKNHGGVKREFDEKLFSNPNADRRVLQDGLGDVTNDDILYSEEFNSINDALNKKRQLTRPDGHKRSPWDMKAYFTTYSANDGTCLLVGLDRKTVPTTPTWGGEVTKKKGNRVWNNGWNHKTNSTRYVDDSDTYYYGKDGQYFGLHNSNLYKPMLTHNQKIKSNMTDDEWNEYQNNRIQNIKKYKNKQK